MATFSATLSPPAGNAPATVYQLKSGATARLDADGHLVVDDDADMRALLQDGWTVVSISRG
jgi:hypothetical protein